jgi:ABC transporter
VIRTRELPPGSRSGRDAPAIEARGLVMRYGDREVLHGIDLVVPHGMVVGFLGPNGAGKTTTVEILEGYRRRSAGQASVLGMDPASGGRELRERIGIVLQETGHNPELSARDRAPVRRLLPRAPAGRRGHRAGRAPGGGRPAGGDPVGRLVPAGQPAALLASLADAFPLVPMLDGMRQALIFGQGPGAIWPDARKLMAWLAVGLLAALRTFRWERAA